MNDTVYTGTIQRPKKPSWSNSWSPETYGMQGPQPTFSDFGQNVTGSITPPFADMNPANRSGFHMPIMPTMPGMSGSRAGGGVPGFDLSWLERDSGIGGGDGYDPMTGKYRNPITGNLQSQPFGSLAPMDQFGIGGTGGTVFSATGNDNVLGSEGYGINLPDTSGSGDPKGINGWLLKNRPMFDTIYGGLQAATAVNDLINSYEMRKLANETFSFEKQAWNKNYSNQVSDYNRQVTDLAAARGGYDPGYDQASYLKRNLLDTGGI